MRLKIFELLLVLTALSAAVPGASADEILYVTDRAAAKKGFGPQRKLESLRTIENLHFGFVESSQDGKRQKLAARPIANVKTCRDFGPVIIDAAKKAGTDEVFVMVHGFNTTFTHAAKNALLLAQQVHHPVILYSWPSKGRPGQYNVDLGNNEWSQEHFNEFLEELNEVKDTTGVKFTLVAHSMGNRLVVASSPVLVGNHLFKQMYLVDPDFDAETFVHYLSRYARKKEIAEKMADHGDGVKPTKVRILFSHRDHALPLSEFLFGGYTRLGQAADRLLSTVVTPFSIPDRLNDAINTVEGKDVENVGAADAAKERDKEDTPQWVLNFEWIDFTVLDHGIIGHTIPYELIANLWAKNEPGEGLKLVHSDNGSPNKMARLFLHVFDEKDHISSKIDCSERVVRASGAAALAKKAEISD